LPAVIGGAMKALPWPKSMKWGGGDETWVRPLQNVVALFDGKVVPGGRFGDKTRGHRFLSKGEIKVSGFSDYESKLRAAHVMLDPAERKKVILAGAQRLCSEAQVTLKFDGELLEEVAGLVEWPVPLMGTIDAQYMELPPEVLTVSMKTHLRYFATTKKDGALANRFVVVANNVAKDGGRTIVAGNERVLRARLSDAKFFWDQDRKTTLASRATQLKDVVFHAKLGSQADRVQRIAALALRLTEFVPDCGKSDVMAAAELCKSDLVTGMVGEFPELQGIMGGHYARAEHLPVAVAEAIGDHYAPAGPNDRLPRTPEAVALALADKLDSLISLWSIGEKPTGSGDPFALRRAALGIIRIVVEPPSSLRLPLSRFVKDDSLMAFFVERLKVKLRESNTRHDVVDAVFALGGEDDLVRLLNRAKAVQAFLATDDGKNLLTAYSRAANIVRAEEKKDKGLAAKIAGAPETARLEQREENAVHEALTDVRAALESDLKNEEFAGAMSALAGLRAPIDSFFDKVTVNVTDKPELRLNRLKLLNQIRATMDSVADFSKIEG